MRAKLPTLALAVVVLMIGGWLAWQLMSAPQSPYMVADGPGSPTPQAEPTIELPDLPLSVENGEVGGIYPVAVWLHCGIRGFQINGEWWTVLNHPHDSPLPGPPRNWDEGSITIVDADRAFYTSSTGVERDLNRGGEEPPPCT